MAGLLQRLLSRAGRAGVGSAAGGALGYFAEPEGSSPELQLHRAGLGALIGGAAGGVSPGLGGLKNISKGIGQLLGFGRPAQLPGQQTLGQSLPGILERGIGYSHRTPDSGFGGLTLPRGLRTMTQPSILHGSGPATPTAAIRSPHALEMAGKGNVQFDRLHPEGPISRHGHLLTPLASLASNVAIDEHYGDPTEEGLPNAHHNALTMAPLGHLGAGVALSGGGRRKLPMLASATSAIYPLLNYLARRSGQSPEG